MEQITENIGNNEEEEGREFSMVIVNPNYQNYLQDENQTYPDGNVNVPSDVTGSSTAVSNVKPAEDNVATSASFLDEESDWVDVVEEEIETVSKRKMKNIDIEEVEESRLLGYRLFHLSILNTVFGNMICPECKTPNLCLQETLKQGLAFKYTITCHNVGSCRWSYSFFNSPRTKKNTTKFSRSFDVNPRTVYSMRRLGQGYTSLKNVLYLMNHPPPKSERSYRQINVKICDSVQIVADNSLLAAAEEVKVMEGLLDDGYCHICFSRWNVATEGVFITEWCSCCNINGQWEGVGRCCND